MVKSERGKAVVRFNANRHGILGTLLPTQYEGNVYNDILQSLHDEYAPVGSKPHRALCTWALRLKR